MNLESQSSMFDRVAKLCLGALIFLMPIAFMPGIGISSATVKFVLLLVLTAIAFVSYLLARLGDRKLVLPSKWQTRSLALVPVAFLASAIGAGRLKDSIFGFGFEPTTVAATTTLSVVAFLTSVYGRNQKTVACAKKLALASLAVVFLYQIVRLFGGNDLLSFSNFYGKNANLLGKWNDLAIIAGVVLTGAFIKLKDKGGRSLAALGLFILAGLVLKLTVFSVIWPVLTIVFLVYVFVELRKQGSYNLFTKDRSTRFTLAGVVLAALFVVYALVSTEATKLNTQGKLLRPNLYNMVNILPNYFGGTPTEVRPNAASTANIYYQTVRQHPVFGVGPNRFVESWSLYRPADINQTPYWNTDFVFGVGYYPTLAVTTGILGTLAFALFIVCALVNLTKLALRKEEADLSVVYGTLLLGIISMVYVPAMTLLVALYLGIGYIFGQTGTRVIELGNSKKSTVWFVTILTVLIFSAFIVRSVMDTLAARYFVLSAKAVQTDKNIDTAEMYLKKSLALSTSDVYRRGYAELLALKAQVIAAQGANDKGEVTQEAQQAALEVFKSAEQYAEGAITANPQNYGNYIFAGTIYANDAQAYEKAIDMFTRSLVYKPNNPDAYFGIAKIKAAQGNLDGVKENLEKALQVREAYTPALLAGAQLTAAQKDVNSTLGLLAKAYQSDTSRADLLIEIANIQYSTLNDIAAATQTLEYAVGTYPNYAEARLALSSLYAKQKKFEDAANLLAPLQTEDEKVKTLLEGYIASLKAGKDPFGTVAQQKSATSTKEVKTTATTTPKKK